MVDWAPWGGNYTGTVVRNNLILGGFATSDEEPGDSDGTNAEDVIIKSVFLYTHVLSLFLTDGLLGLVLLSARVRGSATSITRTSAPQEPS